MLHFYLLTEIEIKIRDSIRLTRRSDGRKTEQGPIMRSMIRYFETYKESKTPTQIKMLRTLNFRGHL